MFEASAKACKIDHGSKLHFHARWAIPSEAMDPKARRKRYYSVPINQRGGHHLSLIASWHAVGNVIFIAVEID